MYEEFYGFRTRPFSILPDADFLYLSKGHRFALSLLEYGLGSQTGFTVVTGEIGSGKTTLVQYLLQNFAADHTIGHITNTAELNTDLLKWLLHAFGVQYSGESKVGLYQRFVDFVRQRYSEGNDCVLIIDEAQHLNAETLESLRLLSNINSGKDHLLKILLVGQPELSQTLARPDLVQFAQRISTSFHLKPLGLLETREYIRTRLKIAGGVETLFDIMSSDFVHLVSGGVPRQINILCDTALVYGYADGLRRIDLSIIMGVLRDRSSSQRSGELGSIGTLDRGSIEKMIRQAREKEFAREAEAGMSPESSSQATLPELSAERVVEADHAAQQGELNKVDTFGGNSGQSKGDVHAHGSGSLGTPAQSREVRAAVDSEFSALPNERIQASLHVARIARGGQPPLSARKIPPSPATLPSRGPTRPFKIFPASEAVGPIEQGSAFEHNVPGDNKSAPRRWSISLQRTALLAIAAILVVLIVVFVGSQRSSSRSSQSDCGFAADCRAYASSVPQERARNL